MRRKSTDPRDTTADVGPKKMLMALRRFGQRLVLNLLLLAPIEELVHGSRPRDHAPEFLPVTALKKDREE